MDSVVTIQQKTRHGFCYFPDTLHYSETDIHRWLPELKALGASWITLQAPLDRAIPESFIRQIIEAGIQPILHLPLSTADTTSQEDFTVLFNAYAHWGVQYISIFDRPNLVKNWLPSDWAKGNLVERFLDIFIPIAENARHSGMIPLFSPLEPGGEYWDTAFLFAALQSIQQRGYSDLLNQLGLSAYAWPSNRSPNWGAGGPERWPRTRPYFTPPNSEDQLGFRIFDWYLAISQAAIGKYLPVFLIGAGSRLGDQLDPRSPEVDVHAHTWTNFTLVQIISGCTQQDDPIPPEVMCCNFWLLSANDGEDAILNAWYKPDMTTLPIVNMVKEWIASGMADPVSASKTMLSSRSFFDGSRPISHYLLLPSPEWGEVNLHLEAIRPFINKYQPTIGFSPVEASHAKKVTVISSVSDVTKSIVDGLLAAGCIVEQISADGMNIATQMTSNNSMKNPAKPISDQITP